jgi:predicted dehydrogenase
MQDASNHARTYQQRWPAPAAPRPIVLIGAGGIVRDAHLPAYRAAGLPLQGVYDADHARAEALSRDFGIPRVYRSRGEAMAETGVVFDLALPPQAVLGTVEALSEGAAVLIQKPLGTTLAEATAIRAAVRARRLVAAMNFQLRFAPNMLALQDAVTEGALGRILELDVRILCRMPWEKWPFLRGMPRLEILMHSIHYVDLLRRLAGEPRAVHARCVPHPDARGMAATRTSAIIDFGADVRCTLSVNHHHAHGPRHEASELRVEGTHGAAVAVMGVNLDYPKGRPDRLELATGGAPWVEVPLAGNWFPDAFRGPMSNLQRFVAGEDRELVSSVEDAWRTMALVEALYESDAAGGTPVPLDVPCAAAMERSA